MRLNCHVPVTDELLRVHVFGPDDEVPEWALKKITNPNVWATQPKKAAPSEVVLEVPPRHGRGSSASAWRAYAERTTAAEGMHIEIPEDASRDDIIEALEGAGIRTE